MRKTLLLVLILVSAHGSEHCRISLEKAKYWIFFKDTKGLTIGHDYHVRSKYVLVFKSLGVSITTKSNWFNAVSANLSSAQLARIRALDIVRQIRPVAKLQVMSSGADQTTESKEATRKINESLLDYGSSFQQNDLINTIPLHSAGITGKNVLIGVIDTGFETDHEVFAETNVIAMRDFINNDNNTADEFQGEQNQQNHGTAILSTVAGNRDGQLIGSAYGASFALAKTESIAGEFDVEEDLFVAALEWFDSIGVDVVSVSLKFAQVDEKNYYTQDDMDGKTTLASQAVNIAHSRGMVVLSGAGNERGNAWGTITAPGDALNGITVGAVDFAGSLASFSSPGPTTDGRTKPDIVAPGVNIQSATAGSRNQYALRNGTSFATPITAGAAALILSAHPQLSPDEVNEAIKNTASTSSTPDNDFGWGLIDVFAAVTWHGPAFSNEPEVFITASGLELTTSILSARGLDESTPVINYSLDGNNIVEINLQHITDSQYRVSLPFVPADSEVKFYFSASDRAGNTSYYPAANVDSSFVLYPSDSEAYRFDEIPETVPSDIALVNNYPNPFNNSAIIELNLPGDSKISVTIYNILGQKVRSLFTGNLSAGIHRFLWDGSNDHFIRAATGTYFYRVTAEKFVLSGKMLFIK